MQYIFLVETNKRCRSDELYIKSFIEQHYIFIGDKLTFEYMDGKNNYNRLEKNINSKIKQYNGNSNVFVCIDLDNPIDASLFRRNEVLNNEIKQYCILKNYELIYFNPDIEYVFLNKKINSSEKKKEAERFYIKNNVNKINYSKTNIKTILDKYFKKR